MIGTMFLSAILIGYFLGAIPFGLLVGKAFAGADIRQIGSGKMGMTNVMRAAGIKAAALSLLLDMGKSAFAVLCAHIIFTTPYADYLGITSWRETAMVLAALSAITGHTWSVFLKFKGGRGVGAFIGGLMVMYWQAAVIGGLMMIFIGMRTKYMSMGSIIGAVSAFIVLMAFSILQIRFFGPYPSLVFVIYAMVGSIFIYVVHKDNIIRLFNGTERKMGASSSSGSSASGKTK